MFNIANFAHKKECLAVNKFIDGFWWRSRTNYIPL